MVKKFDDTYLTIYTQYRRVTDGQDRQTSCHVIVRAMHTRRAVKTILKPRLALAGQRQYV